MTTYNIYRREDGDTNQPVAIATGVTSKNYSDTTATRGRYYLYSVGAVKNSVEKVSDEKLMLFGQEWTPAELSTALYFDASNVVQSSGVVSQMDDLSGNAFHAIQSNNSLKPTVAAFANGALAVKFNGSSQYLEVATGSRSILNSVSAWWMFGVFKITQKSSDNDTLSFGSKAKMMIRGNANVLNIGGRRLSTDSYTSINGTTNIASKDIIGFVQANYSTRNLQGFVNATKEAESTSWLTSGLSDNSTAPVRIGANSSDNPGPGVFSNLQLGCIILGVGVLTEIERQKLEGWAAHKYGLTANLSSGHPYKTLAPVI